MLKIRLARVGKKKQPAYRFVVSESTKDMYGKALEIVGHYNPFTKITEVKKERILHWISKGAQLSPTVHNMLIDQNVIKGEKVKASKSKKKNAESEETPTPAETLKAEVETPAAPTEVKPADVEPVAETPKKEVKPAEEVKVEEKKEEVSA